MVSWQLDLSSTSTGKEVTDKTNKFNLSAFLSLMPRERVIIEILAYNIEPVQGSHFIKLLDNWYVKSGVSEYPIIKQFLLTDKLQLRKVISSLVKKNFIICNNSQNTTKNNRGVDNKYYTVESEWREVILRYIYKVNEYSAIQYIGSNLPGKAYKYSSESKKGIIRYIRDAIYTAKDIDLVFNYINYYLIKCNKDKSSLKIQYKEIIALISEICGKPLDEKWFSMLKPVSQAFYFSIFIKYSFVTFELLSTEMITSIFDYFTRNPKYKINKELFVTFLSYLLLTNNQSNIDVLCFKVQFPAGVKALVDGVRLFFRGKITEAGACFKEARTTVLKAERPFGYFFELFHVLTALSIEDHDSQIWITGTLEKYGNEDDTIWYYLRKFYNGIINNNQKNLNIKKIKSCFSFFDYFINLICAAMIYWNHTPKALELMQPFLTDIISANQTPVNSWILREANALVNSVKDSETKDPQAILPSLIKLKDRWDFVLSEIKAITNPTTGDNADTNVSESNIRLTWRFDGHNFEPYEQTRKNNSTAWSKGRKVALVRLFYDWQERNYLSEADRAICKSLKKECYYNGYGHCDICCIPFNAYKYFIGHPLIFSDKVPMQRVEIIEGKPILEITNKKDQSCIKLNPYPRVESKYEKDEDNDELNTDLEKAVGDQLIRISQYRFQLVHFDNVQLKIANLLTKKGLFVPKGREQETAEILKPLLASFSVQMDSSNADMVGHITTVEEVEPDSRIHLHIIPEGDLLSVEMLVYPLGEMCDSYAPGYGVERLLTTRIDKQMGTKRDFMQEQGNLKMVIDACPSLARAVQKNYRYTFEEPLSSFEFLSQLEALASEYRTFDDFKIHSEKTKKATRKTTKKDQSEEIVESETPVETTDELYRQDSPLIIKWPQGHRIRVSSPVSFSNLRLSITSSKNWFEASGSLNVQGHEIELAELLLSLKESNTRFIQMKKGEYLALSEEFKKKLDEFGYYSSRQGKKIRIHPLATQAIDQVFEDVTHNLGSMKITSQWKECRKRFQEAENLEIKVPKTFQGTLRDYQLEGVQWLGRLAAWGAGGCLADDMGLGKTIQAIVLLLLRANEGPALVVAPTSVCSNWESELNRFAPSLNVKRVSSYVECSTVNRKERVDIIADAKPRDIFITNYSILQIEREAFAKQKYSTIILDEAQAIKNFQTERTQAALTLQGDFRMITTGTPIENHLGELWTLFEFINPGFLGAQKSFDNRFAIPIQRDGDARTKLNLKKLVRPFLLRRFKSDVLQELPGRTDITLEVELSKEEAVLYEVIRRKAVENMEKLNGEKAGKQHLQILAELMRLRRMCCHSKLVLPESDIKCSKLELLGDTVRELLENNHKALIFSQFTDYLKLIAKKMDEMGVTYRYLDGSMSQKKRQVEVDAFQAGESDVFLISLKAGGFGLNLTAADYVIHMDPWWNPAVENQAADRAHRYGQQRPVTVYRMITKGTIEEKIVDLHQRKEKLAQDILDGSDTPAKISLDELMDILKEK